MKFIAILFALVAVASAQDPPQYNTPLAAKCCPGIPAEMDRFHASLIAAVDDTANQNDCQVAVGAALDASVERTGGCYGLDFNTTLAILGGNMNNDTDCIANYLPAANSYLFDANTGCGAKSQ